MKKVELGIEGIRLGLGRSRTRWEVDKDEEQISRARVG